MPSSYEIGHQLSQFVAELVASGRCNSKSEVIRIIDEKISTEALPAVSVWVKY